MVTTIYTLVLSGSGEMTNETIQSSKTYVRMYRPLCGYM